MASFLTVFRDILHAAEVAAQIAAPIISTMDPEIGMLMSAATNAAVNVEATVTAPGSGDVKAAAVKASTQAAIDATNAILVSQGKKPLPATTGLVIATQVGSVVANLNAVKDAVNASAAAQSSSPNPPVVMKTA